VAVTSRRNRWILSGGLASGKSQVRQMLAEAGLSTIDADQLGHSVLEPAGPAFADVAARWPQVVKRGRIDRAALASAVFEDAGELAALESMTHPHIFDTIRARVEGVEGPVVVEIPVLNPRLNGEWRRMVVDSRDYVRLQRAMQRGMSEEDARSRMKLQPSRAEWLGSADLLIPNHGTEVELRRTVTKLLESAYLSSRPAV